MNIAEEIDEYLKYILMYIVVGLVFIPWSVLYVILEGLIGYNNYSWIMGYILIFGALINAQIIWSWMKQKLLPD